MKAQIRRHAQNDGTKYDALAFICPGCEEPQTLSDGSIYQPTGLHMLAVNTTVESPSWDWDGNLEAPTLAPSILTRFGVSGVCHSFLRAGVFEFLADCTHRFAGQQVPIPDLPTWFTHEAAYHSSWPGSVAPTVAVVRDPTAQHYGLDPQGPPAPVSSLHADRFFVPRSYREDDFGLRVTGC